jgi:uncharacterized protein
MGGPVHPGSYNRHVEGTGNVRRRGGKLKVAASKESDAIPAGEFSAWLRGTEASLLSGKGGTAVPCGDCTACCRSSMFIHIKPAETRPLQRIPKALLFPAPGLPKGNVLMGYDDEGRCPMLTDNKCSIYEDRPQTCRSYDCRVFAATGIAVDAKAQPDIARRVKAWVFTHETDASREEHEAVKEAGAFLQKNREMFPQGSLPAHPAPLAALAVRVWGFFLRPANTEAIRTDAEIAQEITVFLNRTTAFDRTLE